ncbi:hypothetical protein ACFVTY_27195 [Streptomyces sp. NPDC058067]|uniref:hypothetical protein n=1 Tax=Streptomyces sp. NPDC058067 TaxID=3346324 RepID=UPI0036EF1040
MWRDAHWRVYRVKDAVPLVSRPARVVASDGAQVVVRFARPGTATLKVAYSPWLSDRDGCLKVTERGEFTRLVAPAAGTYRIGSRWAASPRPSGAPAPGCRP